MIWSNWRKYANDTIYGCILMALTALRQSSLTSIANWCAGLNSRIL